MDRPWPAAALVTDMNMQELLEQAARSGPRYDRAYGGVSCAGSGRH